MLNKLKSFIFTCDIICNLLIEWSKKHKKLLILVILIIGIGLRIGYHGMTTRWDRDEFFYVESIEQLSESGIFEGSTQECSCFVVVGAILYKMTNSSNWSMRIFNLILSTIWLWLMYKICANIWNEQLGIIGLIFATFSPYIIRMSMQIMQEPMYILCLSGGLYCAVELLRKVNMYRNSIILGVLSGIGWWIRFEGAEMLIITPLIMLIYFFMKPIEWNKVINICLLYTLSLSIMILLNCLIFPLYYGQLYNKFLSVL